MRHAIVRILAVALLVLTVLPAAAQAQPGGGRPDGVGGGRGQGANDESGQEDGDAEDADGIGDEDADDDSDDDEQRRPREPGLNGHIAPAIARVGQQVVIHGVFVATDTGSAVPGDDDDEDGEDESDDVHDDETEDLEDGEDDASDEADNGDEADSRNPAVEHDDRDDDSANDGDDADDEADERFAALAFAQEVDTSAATGAPVLCGPDESPRGGRPDTRCVDTRFTIDFGDGTPPEVMKHIKRRGRDGGRRAIARHRFAAAGTYDVTITVTQSDGTVTTKQFEAQVGGGAARLSGPDRLSTAVRVSQESFPDDGSARSVLLARADQFADALSAATLAFVEDAPILLTARDQVDAVVVDEIARALGETGTVHIMGGEAAIGAPVADALTTLGYTVNRLSGPDRVATALAIADFLLDNGLDPDEVILASAGNFPDALAGAAYAAANDALVLLTGRDALDPRVGALLTALGTDVDIIISGGAAALGVDVESAVRSLGNAVQRVAGPDRASTAVAIADRGYDGGTAVVLATGSDYPDALSGAVAAARRGAPVLLVGDVLPPAVLDFLTRHADSLDTVYVLGGLRAVPAELLAHARDAIGG